MLADYEQIRMKCAHLRQHCSYGLPIHDMWVQALPPF